MIESIVVTGVLTLLFCQTVAYFRLRHLTDTQCIEVWDQHVRRLFDTITHGLCIINGSGRVVRTNDPMAEMFGYSAADFMTQASNLSQFNFPDITVHERPFEQHFTSPDGISVWCLLTVTLFESSENEELFLVNFINITEKKKHEQAITQLAYYDTLTKLPNRALFHDKVKNLMSAADEREQYFALFLLDIDHFKRINDTIGHHAGDAVLQHIGKVLKEAIVEYEQHPDNVGVSCIAARLGGDEFVIACESVDTFEKATMIAENLFNVLRPPVTVDGQTIVLTISMGIAFYPDKGKNVSDLLKSADLALYDAKGTGRDCHVFHDASMNDRLERHVEYEKTIRYFIDTQDFEVHYQPIYDTQSNIIICAEALFRSNKLKYGNLDLQELMLIAEETGLIVPLGMQILQRACLDWCENVLPKHPNCAISVNLSMRQLEHEDVVDDIMLALAETGMSPSLLIIEITETAFMHHFDENVRKLTMLRDAGIKIAVDDFGKGYSSMSYIQRLPIAKLKIDIAFIRAMMEDEKSIEIVKIIILLAKTLGLTSLAEGVETEQQYQILEHLGCQEIQGFLRAAPMKLESFSELIES